MIKRLTWPVLAVLMVAAVGVSHAQVTTPLDSTILAGFRWRSVGPANMGGRITDVEGIPSPSKTFFVAAAAGGIWKTTNAGTTFRPVFDHERVISMGDLAIAPSDTMIVWAGTGEEDSRNSISPGGGIYKSTDGGLTWTQMGLTETQTIGRIVIHPTNPDIVYVAALGHIWGSNPERGLYKTTDGGETWDLIKFISDRAGFVDLAMHPTDPNTMFAASWERVRGPYFLKSGGPGSALWKTTDAGATWAKVEGSGFPETMLGRIGIAISPSNPAIMYTMVEADSIPEGDGLLSGLYRSEDGGTSWERTSTNNVRPFYYSQVRVHPTNPDRVYWSSTPVNFSDDGGKTVRNATVGIHVDHHAMWFDPNDPGHFIVGNDGGVSQTWDGGGNYRSLNIMPLGQFYAVSYNMEIPYRVCGGLQDNGSWCGPSRLTRGAIRNDHWMYVSGGDGFFTAQDPEDPNIIYSESQGGNMGRLDLSTGARTSLQGPDWQAAYTMYEDSILIEWPDSTQRPPRAQRQRIERWRQQQQTDSAALALRWNWNTPFFISPHAPTTFYAGANRVMKSTNRGEGLYPISPDLTTQDEERIRVSRGRTGTTGGITRDATGAETYATITALAESPIRPGLLFAGTDDGNVWLTRNDGGAWENLTGRFPGLPETTYVSRIEPSHHDSSTFYVAFDNHRVNDFTPYLYVSSDFGATFRSIASNLPTGGPDFIHVIREDPYNPNLLFVGTDVGVYLSTDRSASWQPFMTGLPTVPVHDLQIHPRDRELIAGTHGRSIWLVDIAALEQLTDQVLAADAFLFEPKTAYQYGTGPTGQAYGHDLFQAQSPQYGAAIVYRLTGGNPRSQTEIVITDVKGDTVQTIQGPGGPGIHRAVWNFRGQAPPRPLLSPSGRRDSVLFVARLDGIIDSLTETGMNAMILGRMREAVVTGNMGELLRQFGGAFGGGRGRGGATRGFAERPGESAARGQAGAAGARRPRAPGGEPGAAGETGQAGGMPGPGMMQDLMRALRRDNELARYGRALGFGGFGGGGPGGGASAFGPMAETGDFLVTITIDGETLSQVLRVERIGDGGGGGFGFDEINR